MVRVWKATFQLTDPSYMHWLRRYSCLTSTSNFVVRHLQFRSSSLLPSSVGFLAYWAFHICELAFLAPILVQLRHFHLRKTVWTGFGPFLAVSDVCDSNTIGRKPNCNILHCQIQRPWLFQTLRKEILVRRQGQQFWQGVRDGWIFIFLISILNC